VLRFLAEDVGRELDLVLDAILRRKRLFEQNPKGHSYEEAAENNKPH